MKAAGFYSSSRRTGKDAALLEALLNHEIEIVNEGEPGPSQMKRAVRLTATGQVQATSGSRSPSRPVDSKRAINRR